MIGNKMDTRHRTMVGRQKLYNELGLLMDSWEKMTVEELRLEVEKIFSLKVRSDVSHFKCFKSLVKNHVKKMVDGGI